MVRFAEKARLELTGAPAMSDDADIVAGLLKDRTLFDMQLDVAAGIGRRSIAAQIADVFQCGLQRDAVAVDHRERSIQGQGAGEGTAAKQAGLEAGALFVGPDGGALATAGPSQSPA